MMFNFRRIVSGIISICIFASVTVGLAKAEQPRGSLRVGFFVKPGYYMIDGSGCRSGYGYEIIQGLRHYMKQDFEYVVCGKDMDSALTMLAADKVDIVTGVVKSPENKAAFEFSGRPILYSSTIMSVKGDQNRFLPGDYSNWNGIRVGALLNSSDIKAFDSFAKEKGFTFSISTFERYNELFSALENGRVDAIVTDNVRKIKNELIYEELNHVPLYVAVKKGNSKLLKEIDYALASLEFDFPFFSDILFKKNFADSVVDVRYSTEELKFIAQNAKKNKEFSVLINPDRKPLSYVENGQHCGVMREIMQLLSDRSGLIFKIISCKDRNDYRRKLAAGTADIVFDMRNDAGVAENFGYLLSPTYLDTGVAKLSRKNFLGMPASAAVLDDSIESVRMAQLLPYMTRTETYQDTASVVNAVLTGHDDVGFLYDLTADSIISGELADSLSIAHSCAIVSFAIGVHSDFDRRLLSIISKTVRSLTLHDIRHCISVGVDIKRQPLSFRHFVSTYHNVAIAIGVGFCLLFLGSIVIIIAEQIKTRAAVKSQAKTMRLWNKFNDILPIHVFAKDPANNFRYVLNNAARANFYGLSVEQMIGINDADFLPKEIADEKLVQDQKIFDSPAHMEVQRLEIKDKNGKIHNLQVTQYAFTDDDGTKLLLGCSVDQTNLEKSLKQVADSAVWFNTIVSMINDAVIATDWRGRITLLNQTAEQLVGRTIGQVHGLPHVTVLKLFECGNSAPLPSPLEKAITSKVVITIAKCLEIAAPDGTRRRVTGKAAPILDAAGKISGAILILRPLTDSKTVS